MKFILSILLLTIQALCLACWVNRTDEQPASETHYGQRISMAISQLQSELNLAAGDAFSDQPPDRFPRFLIRAETIWQDLISDLEAIDPVPAHLADHHQSLLSSAESYRREITQALDSFKQGDLDLTYWSDRLNEVEDQYDLACVQMRRALETEMADSDCGVVSGEQLPIEVAPGVVVQATIPPPPPTNKSIVTQYFVVSGELNESVTHTLALNATYVPGNSLGVYTHDGMLWSELTQATISSDGITVTIDFPSLPSNFAVLQSQE